MASATLSWVPGTGFQPPPPYNPDTQKGFVWLGGVRAPNLDFTVEGSAIGHELNNLGPGEYTVRIYSGFEAELSEEYTVKSFVVAGTPVGQGGGGSNPPSGNPDIAAPTGLSVVVN